MRHVKSTAVSLLTLVVVVASLWLGSEVVASPPEPPEFAQGPSEYFPQTGFSVKGPFLEFFNTHGRLRIFGYPRTWLFYDARVGLWVQFFDNARMEWHPESPEPYRVQLGLLGQQLLEAQPDLRLRSRTGTCDEWRSFPETGYLVSCEFLRFYDENGGLDVFGYPISGWVSEGGYLVQYFQRMRMEWHPERPAGERVVVGPLGLEYIERYGVPYEALARPRGAQLGRAALETRPSLQVWLALRHPVVTEGEVQGISVYVLDDRREAVSGAAVMFTVRYPSAVAVYGPVVTDHRGIAQVAFSVSPTPPGESVIVEATVTHQNLVGSSKSFFMAW